MKTIIKFEDFKWKIARTLNDDNAMKNGWQLKLKCTNKS